MKHTRFVKEISVIISCHLPMFSFTQFFTQLSDMQCRILIPIIFSVHHLILDKSGINERSTKINVDLKLFLLM